jgi:hypothetical protein
MLEIGIISQLGKIILMVDYRDREAMVKLGSRNTPPSAKGGRKPG